MSNEQDSRIRSKIEQIGMPDLVADIVEHQVANVRDAGDGYIYDADITPYESPSRSTPADPVDPSITDSVAVIRLNGGLGTSMGMSMAKSLLPVRGDATFLDIIVEQILDLRATTGARVPLTLLHSFRTSADSLAALASHPRIASGELPIEVLQHQIPKLLAESFAPVDWPADPTLEWCPPGHGDLYPVLLTTGYLDRLAELGFERVLVANSDNLGATPDPEMVRWFADSGAPFALEAVRRTPSDRKGGHFALRRRDDQLILRETAQTPPDEAGDIERYPMASTNNLWFDVAAMRTMLAERSGDLQLPVIVNRKTVDPTDPESPAVIQLETAMGAAIEVFSGSTTVEAGRDRFIPVKTTDDLLVVRSDCYELDNRWRLVQRSTVIPFVQLGSAYRQIAGFDQRFPYGPPSLVDATSLIVEGDWTFGDDVRVVGDVRLGPEGGFIADGTILDEG